MIGKENFGGRETKGLREGGGGRKNLSPDTGMSLGVGRRCPICSSLMMPVLDIISVDGDSDMVIVMLVMMLRLVWRTDVTVQIVIIELMGFWKLLPR